MLDPKQLKVGSVVRMDGKIVSLPTEEDRDVYGIAFKGSECGTFLLGEDLRHAELVSTPVTFDKEQINQFIHFLITLLGVKEEDRRSIIHWLKAHEDKISTDTH